MARALRRGRERRNDAPDRGERRGLVALEGAIEAMLPLDADRRREWQVGVACWGPTAPGEQAAEELRTGWRGLQQLLAGLLQQGVDDGELPDSVDVTFEAGHLVAMLAGVGMLAGIESPERIRRDAKRMLAEQLAGLEREQPDTEKIER